MEADRALTVDPIDEDGVAVLVDRESRRPTRVVCQRPHRRTDQVDERHRPGVAVGEPQDGRPQAVSRSWVEDGGVAVADESLEHRKGGTLGRPESSCGLGYRKPVVRMVPEELKELQGAGDALDLVLLVIA